MNWKKILVVFFFILGFAVIYGSRPFSNVPSIQYGVTFSAPFSKLLNGDWQKAYIAVLDDLGVRNIRLSAYWDEIEPHEGERNFSSLDWQVQEAAKRNARLILAVGLKLPRWPECHIPGWAAQASKEVREQKILSYIQVVVERYRGEGAIRYWQVENEPFLSFGDDCPKTDGNFLEQEIALVRSLDFRPIVVTDSGELGSWIQAASYGDIFGTTMYFQIFNDRLGQFRYPLPAGFFRLKRRITDIMVGAKQKLVIEFQMEPWNKKQIYETSVDVQLETFNAVPFDDRIRFVGKTGFDTVYLWGVEWWYWLKTDREHPEIWDKAKALFTQ